MNLTALDFALKILTSLPGLIQAGVEITSIVTKASDQLQQMQTQDRGPTVEEWQALDDEIDRLRSELHSGDTTGTDG